MSTVSPNMMDARQFARLARRLMSCPAAPFHEAGVRSVVEVICAEQGLGWQRDPFGNVIIRLGPVSKQRPLVLAAHLDHPGFEVVRQLGPRRWEVQFQGGVPDAYFKSGQYLRLLPGAS